MISKFKVTTLLRQILLENEKITELIEARIYPIVAPKDTKGNFIFYQRDEYSRDQTKMGNYGEQCRVYISAVSDSYDISQELAYQIDQSLSGTFTDLGIRINLLDSTEDFADNKYIQVLLFEVI